MGWRWWAGVGFSRWKPVFPQQRGTVQDQGHFEHLINDYVYVCTGYWCAQWELKWLNHSPSLFHFCSKTLQIEIKNKETPLDPQVTSQESNPSVSQRCRSVSGSGVPEAVRFTGSCQSYAPLSVQTGPTGLHKSRQTDIRDTHLVSAGTSRSQLPSREHVSLWRTQVYMWRLS